MAMRPRFLLVTIALLILTIGFGLGVLATASSVTANPETFQTVLTRLKLRNPETDWRTFERVWNELHSAYLGAEIDNQTLIHGATKGLVDALDDPYSVYLNPAESEQFQQEIEGTFDGVGMEVGMKDDKLTVIAPLSNSPAAQAGIRAGDVITAVDNRDITGLSLTESVSFIRGPSGTPVALQVLRGSEALSFSVTRETIRIESVVSRTETVGNLQIGYIQINSFATDTDRAFRQAGRTLLQAGVDGFIIDLRNNPGGLLDQAVAVASAFIPDGAIVQQVERGGEKRTLEAEGNAFLIDQPVVVLVNQGSASASEIVAGALQDTDRATLIGQLTFGKGTVQDFQVLPDSSSLKLTIAEWLTPNGRSINQSGIEPDELVELSEDPDAEDLQLERARNFFLP